MRPPIIALKRGKILTLVAIVSAIIAISVPFAVLSTLRTAPPVTIPVFYRARSPIVISGNGAFSTRNGVVSGNGTSSHPYVISGWGIDASKGAGIQIRNTTEKFVVLNCYLAGGGKNFHGILLENVSDSRIDNVTAEGNLHGIAMFHVRNITVERSKFVGNIDSGVFAFQSSSVDIRDNVMFGNSHGVGLFSSMETQLKRNNVSWNLNGISAWYSDGLEATENTIGWNQNYGGYFDGSAGLLIYHNNFLHNGRQASDSNTAVNRWNSTYPIGGNFWSNYHGRDICSGPKQNICVSGDGIGDTAYIIDSNSRDSYPLISPITNLP